MSFDGMDENWFWWQSKKLRDGILPKTAHDIKDEEMIGILGELKVITVDEELEKKAQRRRLLPRYLVVQPTDVRADPELLSWKHFVAETPHSTRYVNL
ncbi:hypothetical protein N0V88_006223 [Collariella sp. IMI 366227]|nr:hypothetical protein N0V88_006223 [Collariella sp. IMI 366227]